jgi:hypothetical protein
MLRRRRLLAFLIASTAISLLFLFTSTRAGELLRLVLQYRRLPAPRALWSIRS